MRRWSISRVAGTEPASVDGCIAYAKRKAAYHMNLLRRYSRNELPGPAETRAYHRRKAAWYRECAEKFEELRRRANEERVSGASNSKEHPPA